jgi:hypothetical protein
MLTICLVSQGRPQLAEFLKSVDEIVKLDFVNLVLLDNGSTQPYSAMLKDWSDLHENSNYIRLDHNCTDYNELWPEINSYLSDWVVFPGDDDRLIPNGISEWKRIATSNNSLNAIGMSATILKADGSITTDVVMPAITQISSSISPLAHSLHCPPFFWPALFIRTKLIQSPFPISRYIFDWSIGIRLVMDGNFTTSPISSVEYRRHENQESNLVSFNRKVFEGVYWLDQFINSELFIAWVCSRSEDELQVFWRSVIANPPLYGDSNLSNTLLIGIARIIRLSKHKVKIQNALISDLSLRLGSVLHDESIQETLGRVDNDSIKLGNLRIQDEHVLCPTINGLISSVRGVENSLRVRVSCRHQPVRSTIFLNCDNYANLPRRHALDALVRDISFALEESGELTFRISPIERVLIHSFREFKRFIPSILKKHFRRLG